MLYSPQIQSLLPAKIKLASTNAELDRINLFRASVYQEHYPFIRSFALDPFDRNAYILYGENTQGEVDRTLRLVLDGAGGLPEDYVFGEKDIRFYQRVLNARVLPHEVPDKFGGRYKIQAAIWEVANTPPHFFRFAGLDLTQSNSQEKDDE